MFRSPPHFRPTAIVASLQRLIPALSTTVLLASCATSTPPLIQRPNLPAAPNDFGAPLALPKPASGADLKAFALENRKAALLANQRLTNDAAFYAEVRRNFGE